MLSLRLGVKMHLRLVINNTDDLSGGYSAVKDFDIKGGTIGAADESTWQIVDRSGTVASTHVVISVVDNQFCFETPVSNSLYINHGKSPIPTRQKVQITDGDVIQIGKFKITAFVDLSPDEMDTLERRGERWSKRFVSIGSLVDRNYEENITAQNFFESKTLQKPGKFYMRETAKREQEVDPINLIEDSWKSRSTNEVDPMRLINSDRTAEKDEMKSKLGDIINVDPEDETTVDIPDDLQPGSAYIDIPKAKASKIKTKKQADLPKKDPNNSDENIDAYLENIANNARVADDVTKKDVRDVAIRDDYFDEVKLDKDEDGELIDHVLLRPLCIAMGLPIQKMTVPNANRLMRDIGEAIKATVSGLIEAHQRELSDKSHLSETHLHAIEDNPLRLGKSTEDVIRDLFLVNSPVHLSASAAISESLELLQYHEKASEIAADEALDAVLRALGPFQLAKRFKKYKGHAPRAGDLDAWHWQMYQYYYNEIRSEKQGGLARMFWEVFRQVYDREMREQSLEG